MKTKQATATFPVVGMGASAGGLDAYMKILSNLPLDTGMAFVLVQHLDPSQPSLSVEILSKCTKLQVQEVTQKTVVGPNQVYVIPPNHKMNLVDGLLHLSPREESPTPHLTIDFFFQSLAEAKGEGAIGILLSGTGIDGTQGLRAIKVRGGATYAQDPASAKYSEMPEHAISENVVDLVMDPEEIASDLARVARHPYIKVNPPEESENFDEEAESTHTSPALKSIFAILQKLSHVEFVNYKSATIERRIHRRMMLHKLLTIEDYAEFLAANPDEGQCLFDELLINVTEFFRDPETFETLEKKVFPRLFNGLVKYAPIRVWVPGCSTGEEAYSIAIALFEYMHKTDTSHPLQIFASDISKPSINFARLGVYPETISSSIPADRLNKYFEKTAMGRKICKTVRDVCVFSIHDMTRDPPFAKLDFISCRNALIYFTSSLQKRVIPIFHYSLKPQGYLLLGKSETPNGFSKLFMPVDKIHKLYTKVNPSLPVKFELPLSKVMPQAYTHLTKIQTPIKPNDFQRDADKIMLSKYSPPSVVVDPDCEVLQFRGSLNPYLEPSIHNNLIKMARPELTADLRLIMQAVKKENRAVSREGIKFKVGDAAVEVIIEAQPINPQAEAKSRTYLILFQEKRKPTKLTRLKIIGSPWKTKDKSTGPQDQRIAELVEELAQMKAAQQLFQDQYESTNDEFNSTNEELMTGNEELQSANEELETSKEELQSTNEELVTVNDELQMRNNELTRLGGDLSMLLRSLEMPIIMVDNLKHIRRFTREAEESFNLIPSDIGRPIGHINTDFEVNIDGLINEVEQTRKPKEIELEDSSGAWRRLQVRPTRSTDGNFDGCIISLIDIDKLKKKEKRSLAAYEYVSSVAESVPIPLAEVTDDLSLKSGNHSFFDYFRLPKDVLNKDLIGLLASHEDELKNLRAHLSKQLKAGKSFTDFEIAGTFGRIGARKLSISVGKVRRIGAVRQSYLLSFLDITERSRIEDERNMLLIQEKAARTEAEKASQAKDTFLATLSHELRTPLSAIMTWAELIKSGKLLDEKVKYGASVIEQSARTQSQLIDDLLDISRIISGKLALHIKEVAPAPVIAMAIESVKALSQKKDIQIQLNLSPEAEVILADPMRLQQVVWNLLTNAIKFSPKGSSIEVELEYILRDDQSFAEIRVSDHGKGIPVDFLPFIFNRFSQADGASTRVHGGLGLGLSIVDNLVELQGGTVWAQNRTGGTGAVFTVHFPVFNSNAIKQSDPQGGSVTDELVDVPDLSGLRILFVDDDERTREAISLYLVSYGAEVCSVDSADAAFLKLPLFRPDLLLSDIAMPNEDGHSLIKRVRQLSAQCGGEVPAVALTAFASAEDINYSLECGFDAHLAKPVEALKLGQVIKRLAIKAPV